MPAYSDAAFLDEQVRKDTALGDDTSVVIDRDGDEIDYQPASVDLHLGPFMKREQSHGGVVDVTDPDTYPAYTESYTEDKFTLDSKEFVLATTQERVELDRDVVGFLWGRSSVGRLGVFVHNAGLIDPGYEGELTLELFNASNSPVALPVGMSIVQMTVHTLDDDSLRAYGEKESKYQQQNGVTPSRLYEDFE